MPLFIATPDNHPAERDYSPANFSAYPGRRIRSPDAAVRLRERPLIVMECSVIAERYLGLGYSDRALDLIQHYRDTCRRFQGDFSLLWHNSHLDTANDRRFYQTLVA
jgi:hypothetical protein